jgi:hypothetical protein
LDKGSTEADYIQAIIKIIEEEKPKTVRETLNLTSKTLKISEHEAMELVLKLQNERKIRLEREIVPAPKKLTGYLRTEDALWYWVVIILALGTAVVTFTIPEDLYPWAFARYITGTIFILWLPGYTVMKALYPRQVPVKLSTENLDTIERIALSLGLSLAVVPIVGLLLNYTSWGLRLTPIVLSLLVLTIFSATIAAVREYREKMKKQDTVEM